jgi:PGF-pre-PGF domain-containing protein
MAVGEHLPASYKGFVTIDGMLATSATVSVYNSTGKMPPQELLFDNGSYQLRVVWDDPATPEIEGISSGQTITFKVNGITARQWTVSEADTQNTGINLEVTSSTQSPTSNPSSSGGGGGASPSAEAFENILKKETREAALSRDVPRSFGFTTPELPVSEVAITSNTNAGLINVQVELLKNRSTTVKDDAPGDVYKYLNIWVGTSGFAVPKNIKEAVIKFKLENSWITSRGFKESDIAMLKWDGTQWISLATEKKSSDDKFTSYEAKTNAFSPFAISGVKGIALATESAEVTEVTTEQTEAPAPAATKKAPGFVFVLAIAGLIAAVLRKRS